MAKKGTTEAVVGWVLGYPKVCIASCLLLLWPWLQGWHSLKRSMALDLGGKKMPPPRVAFEKFESRFGDDGHLIVALKDERGIFTPNNVRIIGEIMEALQQLPHVLRVESLYNYNYVITEGDSIIINPFSKIVTLLRVSTFWPKGKNCSGGSHAT